MRTILLLIILGFGLGFAQPCLAQLDGKTINNWTYTELPVTNVLTPVHLQFTDSLHGFFCCHSIYEDALNASYSSVCNSFSTTDGGKTWNRYDFNGFFPDTLVKDGSFYQALYFELFRSQNRYAMQPDFLNPNEKVIYIPSVPSHPGLTAMDPDTILKSTDNGYTWTAIQPELKVQVLAAIDSKTLLGLYGQNDTPQLRISFNSGKNFSYIIKDPLIFPALYQASNHIDSIGITNLVVANSDFSHWTGLCLHSIGVGASRFPPGISTLVTVDGGNHWEYHSFVPPGLEGINTYSLDPQYIKGTSSLYAFSTRGTVEGQGGLYPNYHPYASEGNGDCSYGLSFLYSSDYGRTWDPHFEFGKQRRAYEAVETGNIWMTITLEDSITQDKFASVIVHSTDNGITWDTDRTTLSISDYPSVDGRILIFSDARHGWCCAMTKTKIYLLRYVAPPPASVEKDEYTDQPKEYHFLKIYPNPADQQTTLLTFPVQEIRDVNILDLLGRKAPFTYDLLEKNKAIVDTHLLQEGVYFAQVKYWLGGFGVFTEKFVVSRP